MKCTFDLICVSLFLGHFSIVFCAKDEDQGPVIPPSKCEVCKFLATELKERLDETGKSKEVLELGHEALQDPHICEKILDYNIHKERDGSNRDKGVKVDLGIPYELWDTPSAEVTQLQRECFNVVERYEEAIEDWYYKYQDQDIMDYLCRKHVLKPDDQECLDETWKPKGDRGDKSADKPHKEKSKKKKDKKKLKGDSGIRDEL
ncbi:CNPY3-like protein [Mya arenaria]|uniref:CNPY3-like protein n=1 Tax=Mya arenaria TaxID=6604 RepID=A0ABY7DFD0_MYAAR|nr:CNPY3-like protein [Mya arenaria]